MHYQISLISLEALIICISQSEKSYEVIKLIKKIQREKTKEVVNPVFWSDNFITLFPGDEKVITARVAVSDAGGVAPTFVLSR